MARLFGNFFIAMGVIWGLFGIYSLALPESHQKLVCALCAGMGLGHVGTWVANKILPATPPDQED